MVFLGGAVLANIVSHYDKRVVLGCRVLIVTQMASNNSMWVTKAEWQEQGPRVLTKFGPR